MEQAIQREVEIEQSEKKVSLMFWFWIALFVAFVATTIFAYFEMNTEMMSGIYIVSIVGHICTKQNKYLDVFIFIFLTIIALSLMATLSWCGVVLLWPDKYNVNSFIPIYKTPLGIIQTVLYIGAIEGGVMSAFGCLMKWFFGKYETEKKHPLVAAMETRAEE